MVVVVDIHFHAIAQAAVLVGIVVLEAVRVVTAKA